MASNESNCGPGCGCNLPRRDFLKLVTLGTASAILPAIPAVAGPFAPEDFDGVAPADKKLDRPGLPLCSRVAPRPSTAGLS